MSESTSVTTPVFSQHQLVREFQKTCAPRQRALLSLLAICQKHDLEPSPFVASLSQDLPRTPLESRRKTRKFYWSRIHDFSEDLKQVPTMADRLDKSPGLLPDTVELALRLEQEQGTLDELNDAWLNRPPDHVSDSTRNESFVATMFPLFLKTFFILWLTSQVLIYVIPQFIEMLEEFDMPLPPIFQLTLTIIDTAVKYNFFPVLLFLIAIPFCISFIVGYSKRWNPFVWQQPILPTSVSTRQALALVANHARSKSTHALARFSKLARALYRSDAKNEATNDKPLDWEELASQGIISGKEAQALKMADSCAVQAWLLQKSAIMRNHRIESRGMFLTRAAVTTVNVILGALVLLLAVSVFSMLISIMSHLR